MTLYGMEPWGDERRDLADGRKIGYMVAAHGGEPKSPQNYMPLLKHAPVKRQSEEDIQKAWDGICDVMERTQRDQRG